MPATLQHPIDRRAVGKAVGDELLKRHGKKRFYTVHEVADVVHTLMLGADALSQSLALYSTADEFNAYHATIGEPRDYAKLKGEMFEVMVELTIEGWFEIDMSWLDWPDFDFSGFFDFFDFSL